MMFRILALTGEKIEKAVDFQSREHETQVSEYLHGLPRLHELHVAVLLGHPGTAWGVHACALCTHLHSPPPPKEKSRMKPR